MRDVFMRPAGQDDNLGDSVLRKALVRALSSDASRLHVLLDTQTSDYIAGLPLRPQDVRYRSRRQWHEALRRSVRPVYAVNAGEVSPRGRQRYPQRAEASDLRDIVRRGGAIIAAGVGLRDPAAATHVRFDAVLDESRVLSWRDVASKRTARIGDVSPDWAFALGPNVGDWNALGSRPSIAVTLRFDRPWPGEEWVRAVRSFAADFGVGIVTVAQVARDAPRAVALASALGGRYLTSPSMSHDALDAHVRSVYADSIAVVSDRAHALIIGATEGAFPLGSAHDPQKISRILHIAGLDTLTGDHTGFARRVTHFSSHAAGLPRSIEVSRAAVFSLEQRIQAITGAPA